MSQLRTRSTAPAALALVAAIGLPSVAAAGPPAIGGESTVSASLSAEVRADLTSARRSGAAVRHIALARISRAVHRLELAQAAATDATASADAEARLAARRLANGLTTASKGLTELVGSTDRLVAARARTALRRLAELHAAAAATVSLQADSASTAAEVEAGARVLADLSASLHTVLGAVADGAKVAQDSRRRVITEVLEARSALATAARRTRVRAAATGASVGTALGRVVAHATQDAARIERSSLGTVRVRVSADGRLSLAEFALRVVAASQASPYPG